MIILSYKLEHTTKPNIYLVIPNDDLEDARVHENLNVLNADLDMNPYTMTNFFLETKVSSTNEVNSQLSKLSTTLKVKYLNTSWL